MNPTELKVGNWVLLKTENCYCIVRKINTKITIERHPDIWEERLPQFFDLIAFNEDVLSLAQFAPNLDKFKKEIGNEIIVCAKVSKYEYQMIYRGNKSSSFSYVHEFQNEYFKLTELEIIPNLFGIKL